MGVQEVVDQLPDGVVQDLAEDLIRDYSMTRFELAVLRAYFKIGPRPVIIARVATDSVTVKESVS